MSEILLHAKDLKPVMLGLGKVVSRKSTLPVLENIRISRENKVVTLQATDLNVWATYRFTEHPGETAVFHVPFETLNKIVKAIKGDALITLHQDKDKARLVYEVGNSPVEVKLNGLGKAEWPTEPKVEGVRVLMPETFKPALKEALECASSDSSRYVINGACLDVAGKDGHYIVGTNGSHLFASNSFEFGIKASLIIPSGKFVTWAGFAGDGPWNLVAAKVKDVPWLKITSDYWTFTSKQVDGNYPNWRQCRPTPNSKWTRINIPQSEVEALLRNIPLLPGNTEPNHPVTLQVTADAVLLKARAKDATDWTTLRLLTAQVTGNPVETCLNREYLLKALRFGLLELDVEDSLSPVLFSSKGRQMVVMPIRGEAADREMAAKDEAETAAKTNPPTTPSAEPGTEERKTEMPAQTATERENLKSHLAESSPYKEALGKVESLKGQLRQILGELNDLSSQLKQAEKEKRSTEKEVASVRQTIRSLQSLKI